MLTLININRMSRPIAPLGLDYVGATLRRAGVEVDLLDLCLASNPDEAVQHYCASRQPELIGISIFLLTFSGILTLVAIPLMHSESTLQFSWHRHEIPLRLSLCSQSPK